jgi:hypothetical protein
MEKIDVEKLSKLQYKIDQLDRSIRDLEADKLTVYAWGNTLHIGNIPDLTEKVNSLLLTEYISYRDELVTKRNTLVLCTAKVDECYMPTKLLDE